MALRKVIGRKKFKIFRGYMLLGYGMNLFLECGHTEYRKYSMSKVKTAQCKKCNQQQINRIQKRNNSKKAKTNFS